jgi:GNAT superfamily N-acetyltransferase
MARGEQIHTVARERWDDLAALFAMSPVTSGCWCMWPRVAKGEMYARTPEENRRDLRVLVDAGKAPGLLAYAGGEPVGWCAVGPRRDFRRFANEGDADGAWLIACLYRRGSHRGLRIGAALVEAAVAYAAEHGATVVEGPPHGWRPDDEPASLEGVLHTFRSLGFRAVADPRSPVLMRKEL